jgi:hypothetical protein
MAAENRPEPGDYSEYILRHSDFGDPECCGLFLSRERGDVADLRCNECGFVLQSVPVADLQRVQDQMQAKLGFATETCLHCRHENHFPAFSSMLAYVCPKCGESVNVSEQ